MSDAAQTAIKGLNDLLDSERAALLSGDLGALEGIASKKQVLLETLHEVDAEDDLQNLQQRLDRNRVLLLSAMNGIKRVAERLRQMQHLRRSLDTYSCEGQRQCLETEAEHRLERRA